MKISILTALAFAAALSACAHRQALKEAPGGSAPAGESADARVEPDVRAATMVQIPEVEAIHFDYDSAALGADARKRLAANARWLDAHPDVRVQVEGHCDERGTIEYNLALGQRRAAAVRSYYMRLGIPGKRVATISFGKERPLCAEANETCWQRNRRADTLRAAANSASKH